MISERWSEVPASGGPEADELLLERARRGDADALGSLATRHWGNVQRVARNMLPSAAASDEVAEAVFLSLLVSVSAFPRGVPFRTSLYRAALGECWRRLPSSAALAQGGGEAFLPRFDANGRLAFDGEDWAEARGSVFAERFGAAQIRKGLQRLEPLDRAAFLLRQIEHLGVAQAAEVLGIPEESIRERTHRALLILTGFLSGAGVPGA